MISVENWSRRWYAETEVRENRRIDMWQTVWGIALTLLVVGTCSDIRASDTPDGRPAVSGRVERALTKEEIEVQRLKKEVDEMRRQIKERDERAEARMPIENRGDPATILKRLQEYRRLMEQTIPLGPYRR